MIACRAPAGILAPVLLTEMMMSAFSRLQLIVIQPSRVNLFALSSNSSRIESSASRFVWMVNVSGTLLSTLISTLSSTFSFTDAAASLQSALQLKVVVSPVRLLCPAEAVSIFEMWLMDLALDIILEVMSAISSSESSPMLDDSTCVNPLMMLSGVRI